MARQYAPALSQQEFKQRRPGGNYQNYLNFLERKRPGWKAPQALRPQHVPPPMRGPLPTYESLLRRVQIQTPQQMEAQANRMAQTQLKSQRQIMQEEYRRAADDAMRRMQAFAAAGREAASMNASLIGQVGSQYQAGADQLNAMAAGGASMMAGATAADVAAANNALGNVGAPALSVGGPVGAPGIAGDTQAGVEAYRGGTLPANAMQSAGGYAMAGQAGQISSQNLRATQEAQAAYMQAMGEADRNKASAIKELVAGRPQIAMQFLQQLQDNQRQAIALSQGLIGSSGQKKQQGFENKVTTTKLNADLQQQAFNNQMAMQEAAVKYGQVDAVKSQALGYLVDARGRPILQGGKKIPFKQFLKAAGATKGAGGRSLTPGQYVDLMQKASQTAESLYYGYATNDEGKRVPANQVGGFDPDAENFGLDTPTTGRLTYDKALSRLTNMGVSRQQARAILGTYYGRGEAGAPIFTSTEIKHYRKLLGARKFQWALRQIKDLQGRGQWGAADQLIAQVQNGGTGISWVGKS